MSVIHVRTCYFAASEEKTEPPRIWSWVLYNFAITFIACVLAFADSRIQPSERIQSPYRKHDKVPGNIWKRAALLKARVKIALNVYFLDKPPHIRLLLSSAVLVTVLGFLVSRYCYVGCYQLDESIARATLTSMAEILITILAISVSLILLGLQYVSETYTPRITGSILGDSLFLGYLATYSIVIFMTEGILTFPAIPLHVFLPYSYLLLVFCIVYLRLREVGPCVVELQLWRQCGTLRGPSM